MTRFNRLISLHDATIKYNKHESTLRTLIAKGRFKEGIDLTTSPSLSIEVKLTYLIESPYSSLEACFKEDIEIALSICF